MVAAWHRARQRGEEVLMTAPTNDAVLALNRAAQDTRIRGGELEAKRSIQAGGSRLHVGDEIVSRRNDRDLLTDRGHPVHNRDQWVIERLHRDRSVTVSGANGRIRLPVDYVSKDVELAYAQTAHGAQGRTVDRSLTLIDGPVDARGIYVPMTRGRDNNIAYVAVEPGQSARDVMAAALSRDWIDRPALDVVRDHHSRVVEEPALLSSQTLRFAEIKDPDWFHCQLGSMTIAADRVTVLCSHDLYQLSEEPGQQPELITKTPENQAGFSSFLYWTGHSLAVQETLGLVRPIIAL
jgi:hypothetical protein